MNELNDPVNHCSKLSFKSDLNRVAIHLECSAEKIIAEPTRYQKIIKQKQKNSLNLKGPNYDIIEKLLRDPSPTNMKKLREITFVLSPSQ